MGPRTEPPDLTGPVHSFFARDRWEIADEDYQLLLPSMRLGTRLLEVAMPYIASFLPSSIIFGSPQDPSHAEHARKVCPNVISLKKSLQLNDLQEAELELQEIAKCVKWRLNERMHAKFNWNGITRIVDHGEQDFKELDENDIRESDAQCAQAGQVRRPLVIAIMDLLLVPMRTHPITSEIRLKAQFMAAVTMVHEIGHAIFLQDYRSFNPPSGYEPYVGQYVDSELGRSFIAWIFNGFHPQFCESHEKNAQFGSLGWSLYWEPLHKYTDRFEKPMAIDHELETEHKRPLYEKLNAIPVTYLSNTFRQSWWDANARGVPLPRLAATLRASLKLNNRDETGVATAVKANWWVDPVVKRPRWKGRYRIMKFSSGQPVEGLLKDQVVAEMKLRGQTFSFAMADDEDDYDDEFEDLSVEQPQHKMDPEVIPGTDNRMIIAYTVETHDDGMLDEDIGHIEDDDSEIVTQIEVRYRPTAEFQPRSTELVPPSKLVEQARKEVLDELAAEEKAEASAIFAEGGSRSRKRLTLDDTLYLHGPSKRLRTIVDADKPDENATLAERVVKALDQASANEVGHWTRIQAWHYCSEHGLELPELPRTAAAQQAKLDNGTETGYKLMRKIQFHLLQVLWNEVYIDGRDPESVIIAKYILGLVDFFLDEDIDKLYEAMGRESIDSQMKDVNDLEERRNLMRSLTKDYFQEVVNGHHLNSPPDNPLLQKQLKPLHSLAPEPAQWSEDDLRSWCRHNGIPQWGSISGLIARVNRYRKEENTVKVGIAGRPKPPPGRADATGTETYYFSAVLRHSTLDSLKSSLFIAGNFPSDTELDLWVNSDEILQPGPLDKQSPTVDWKRLVLRASRTATPKEPEKVSREDRIKKIKRHNDLIDDKLREVHRNPEIEIQKDLSTKIHRHPGSVLNKVTDISQRSLALTRIRNAPGTIPGQVFKKHDRAHLLKGRHLNDMIMDLEDLEASREKVYEKKTGPEAQKREARAVMEPIEREQRRVTHMKLVGQRFSKEYGVGERLGVGEEDVKEEVKPLVDEEDDWQEDYV